jgi:selenocysteine-specific elongation factor
LVRLKEKYREGVVDRVEGSGKVIVRGMFKRESDLHLFVNEVVQTADGREGRIEGAFGLSGKVRVDFEPSAARIEQGQQVAMVRRKFLFQ